MKWFIKSRIKDLEYCCDWLLHLFFRGDRQKPRVFAAYDGLIAPDYSRPVCLFCSYDAQGVVRAYVYQYLHALAAEGFDVVFITSSPVVTDADREKLRQCCVRVIHRENRGYDFYGWKIGMEAYPMHASHDGLLLANDSVIGPLFGMGQLIDRLKGCDADIVGMTDSQRYFPHLQSYFLYCRKPVIQSGAFRQFFAEMAVIGRRWVVIRKYEIGFSRRMGAQFRLSALYDVDRVTDRLQYRQRPKQHLNQTTSLWRPLITEMQFPFLKKRILTESRASVAEVQAALAEGGSSFDTALLAEVVQRDARPAPAMSPH